MFVLEGRISVCVCKFSVVANDEKGDEVSCNGTPDHLLGVAGDNHGLGVIYDNISPSFRLSWRVTFTISNNWPHSRCPLVSMSFVDK